MATCEVRESVTSHSQLLVDFLKKLERKYLGSWFFRGWRHVWQPNLD